MRLYACYVAGVLLFGVALLVAQRFEVGETLRIDFQGATAQGSAESMGAGLYRLRYTHPTGTVYARSYRGRVAATDPKHATPIRIAYSQTEPQKFQPAGASYLPGAIVLLLSGLGASLVFYANHRLVRRSMPTRKR